MSRDRLPPPFTPLCESLPSSVPFVGPETLERRAGKRFRARIGANENVFGPSPRVIEAIRAVAATSWMYCDPEMHDLRVALAAHHGVAPENIIIGEGIDGLFGVTVRLFVEAGVTVATSLGAYPTFNFHVHGFGGRLVTTPYVNDREDPASLLDLARRENARLIFFSNPDNPMGSWWPAQDIAAMISALPHHTLLLLDEAYGEFAPEGTLPPLDTGNPQVLRYRTFSKAYGLAGLRVGYAIGHASIIKAFDKVRNHFGVTRIGQQAAIAALADAQHLQAVLAKTTEAKAAITAMARRHGLTPLPSASNFVTIDCGGSERAKALLEVLIAHGIFIRMPGVAPLNRCIRITAAAPQECALLETAMAEAVQNLP